MSYPTSGGKELIWVSHQQAFSSTHEKSLAQQLKTGHCSLAHQHSSSNSLHGGGVRDGGGARLSRHLVVFAVLISGAALQHLALWQSTKFPHNRVPDTGNLPHVDPPGQEHPLENESSRGASERATTGGGAAVVEGLSSQGASWPGGDVGVGEQEPSDRHRHGRDRDREAGKHRDPKPLHPATKPARAPLKELRGEATKAGHLPHNQFLRDKRVPEREESHPSHRDAHHQQDGSTEAVDALTLAVSTLEAVASPGALPSASDDSNGEALPRAEPGLPDGVQQVHSEGRLEEEAETDRASEELVLPISIQSPGGESADSASQVDELDELAWPGSVDPKQPLHREDARLRGARDHAGAGSLSKSQSTIVDSWMSSGLLNLSDSDGKMLLNETEDEVEDRRNDYKNCASKRTGGPPSLEGLPLHLPIISHRRVALTEKNLFINKENYEQMGLAPEIKHPFVLPDNMAVIKDHYKWDSCAVVGNGGSLLQDQLGADIDKHDLVFRFNQVPVVGYENEVGHKTSFRVLNALWTQRYAMGKDFMHTGFNCDLTKFDIINNKDTCIGRYDPTQRLPQEPDVTFITSRVSGFRYSALVERFYIDNRRDLTVLFLSPRVVQAARRLLTGYRVKLCKSGRGPYEGGNVPSSGFVSVFLLHNLCKNVSVYGFGKYRFDGKVAQYHYYDGLGSRKMGTSVHSWTAEQLVLEQMAREKHIRYCVPGGGVSHVPGSNCTNADW